MLVEAVLAVVSLLILFYLWLYHNFTYWQRRGVPQPSWTFWVKSSIDVLLTRDSFTQIYERIYKQYPDSEVVGIYSIHDPKLLVRSPPLIKKVLISEFSSFHDNEFQVNPKLDPYICMDPSCVRGDQWKPHRGKLIYYLTGGRVKELFPLVKEILPKLDSYIDENLGKDVDAKQLAALFFMDNISNNVLGIASNCFTDPTNDFQKMAELQMKGVFQSWWKTSITFNLPALRDLLGFRFVPLAVKDYLENIIKQVVDYRKQNNVIRNDLLQHIMKREMGSESDNLWDMIMLGVTFFIEGFETSSMTAAPVLYELAVNPDIQETLHRELEEKFGDKFNPDLESILNLPYLQQVIQESSRKYPVLFNISRICTKPTTLDIHGKTVPVELGTPCVVSPLSMHNDPQYFPEPRKFDPERFNETNKGNITPNTFMPFGDGPRICPGIKFAEAQIKLLISNIVHKYRLQCTEKTPPTLTFDNCSFVVVPDQTLWISLEKRHK